MIIRGLVRDKSSLLSRRHSYPLYIYIRIERTSYRHGKFHVDDIAFRCNLPPSYAIKLPDSGRSRRAVIDTWRNLVIYYNAEFTRDDALTYDAKTLSANGTKLTAVHQDITMSMKLFRYFGILTLQRKGRSLSKQQT